MKRYLFNNLNKNLFLENIFMEFKMDLNNFADSHCHLNYPGLIEQQSSVIKRMKGRVAYALNVVLN